jgi:hypothetical protein
MCLLQRSYTRVRITVALRCTLLLISDCFNVVRLARCDLFEL